MATSTQFPFRLILASGSWGRKWLMEQAGYHFEVKPSNIDEPTEARLGDCRHYVGELAWLKAEAVALGESDGLIIAADTVGWLHGKVIGKPEDEADARRIIKALAGTVHELWTGVCLWLRPGDRQICWQERSLVRMSALSDAEIDAYLKTRKWEGCSGAYSIEFPHDPYLTIEEGSVSNVVGLPMESLEQALEWMRVIRGTR
ncbi:maf protein : Maf-like protein HGMM_F07G10C21 OS=uncultured planctomycete GN=HGMM_F07G10C21 PE=3 SV=1: Maf [Gemmata massiliana]|uniref:Nucleoside triphosphate pyrophosphatase n=1 Tax=Gemmata massiliana TaxID=1210884 RepID=A0A6P2CPU5_9BACT|nr:Maf family protein [Gemmata massiliana]VTR90923.1 maf protein : Maf-like protein HGMM_F07G10C21 OS=uncultured planctomycete GN=HGMM_F07G10C21 PE=3 SV=1: Maf [Gemmata massiliana]